MDGFILHEDANWLVVNKPIEMPVRGSAFGELGVIEWLALHHNRVVFSALNLGTDASGVLILAKSQLASERAQAIHDSGESERVYLFWSHRDSAKVLGQEAWEVDTVIDDQPAKTRFEKVQSIGTSTLYRARFRRYQKHQIRKHASEAGIPILGDTKYGGERFPRLCLHCEALHWPEFEAVVQAVPPPSFEALIGRKGQALVELAICQDRRLGWLHSVTDALRVVHRGEVAGRAFAAEVLGEHLSIWFFDPIEIEVALEHYAPLIQSLMQVYRCQGAFLRVSNRDPHRNKLVDHAQWIGEPIDKPFVVTEHDLKYAIQLVKGKHNGLFLDQRDARRRIAKVAQGQRMANLFAFTCSFSQAAVAEAAEVVFSVDLAKGCLNTGKNNFALNQLTERNIGKFVQEDARKWLSRQLRRKAERPDTYVPLDIIVCDPPVFAGGKKGESFSVEAAWTELADASLALLNQNGIALFANNHRGGNEEYYRDALKQRFQKVYALRPPMDFPLLNNVHVRSYWCEV